MIYGSLFSGIEAASAAWHPLGWTPAFFSEIEPFPSAVLAHRFPTITNHGDVTKYKQWGVKRGSIDVMVGGSPCQAFSVAGKREGLSDDRGNLMLTFCEAADEFDPEFVLWENVPGVLSSKDNAFGFLLAGLCGASESLSCGGSWPSVGVVSGEKRTVAWRVLDAQYFGVAQRRRRVFVLAVRGSRNWSCSAALFPVGESVYGNSTPSRKARTHVAALTANGVGTCGADDNQAQAGHLITSTGDISHCLNAGGMGRIDYETETMIVQPAAATLTAHWHNSNGASAGNNAGMINPVVCVTGEVSHALKAEGADASEDGTGRGNPIVTVSLRGRDGGGTAELGDEVGNCLRASNGGGDKPHVLAQMAVRRLTPRECERLQGFPDDWTLVPVRGKPAADGPRYKAIGNSMAVPVMQWIGMRIEFVKKNY